MPRKITRDHAKKTQRPMVEDRVIAEHLTALLTPAIKSQSHFFRELGLRERTLTLPLMVAAVSFRTPIFPANLPGLISSKLLSLRNKASNVEPSAIQMLSNVDKVN